MFCWPLLPFLKFYHFSDNITGKERGLKVIQLFPEGGNLGLVLPKELSKWTMEKVRKEGIKVHPGNTLETAAVEDGKVKVKLSGGEEVRCACVCVCVCVWKCHGIEWKVFQERILQM